MSGERFMRIQNEQRGIYNMILDGATRAIYNPDIVHEIITDPREIQEYEDRIKPKNWYFNRINGNGRHLIDIWDIEELRGY